MKKIFCIASLTILSLQAGHNPLVPAVPFAPLALAVASSLPAAAMVGAESSEYGREGECSLEEPESVANLDDYVDEALRLKKDAKLRTVQEKKDFRLRWQKKQAGIVVHCKKPLSAEAVQKLLPNGLMQADAEAQKVLGLCPLEGESIVSYIERMHSHATFSEEILSTLSLMEDKFWDLPWSMQRHILAMNLEVGLLAVNDNLPIAEVTPLQHAAEKEDSELIYFLLDRGASPHGLHPSTFDHLFDAMMRSNEERSITALSRLLPRANKLPLNWAAGIAPALVLRKASMIFPSSRCIPRYYIDLIKGDSPGETALKEFIKRRGDWLNCADCTIL